MSDANRRKSGRKRARRRKRRILFAVEIAVIFFLVIALFVVYKLDLADTGNKKDVEMATVNDEVQAHTDDKGDDSWNMNGYTNIALFGVDSRDTNLGKGARTDTIMIASLNNKTGEVKLCSVFRDTYLNIGNDTYNKANSAYSAGGAEQAIQMLNTNLDLDIDAYVTVGFKALVDTIDDLGGVEVNITEEEIHFLNDYQIGTAEAIGIKQSDIVDIKSSGLQTLNGLQATSYCRIRYTKGDDFKRAERQRTVLTQIAEKAMASDPSTLNDIIDDVFPLCSTSLSKAEMVEYAAKAATFKIGEQSGFPFERSTGTMGKAGSSVVADNFSQNVIELHQFLFGDSEYSPSQTVQDISSKIQSDRTKNGV